MDLKSKMLELTIEEGITDTGIENFDIYRVSQPYERTSMMLEPAIYIIVQGRKSVYLGNQEIVYDGNNYIIGSAKMPIETELKKVSPEKPYLGMSLFIDPALISELLVDTDEYISWPDHAVTDRILTAASIDQDLVQSLLRLLDIIGDPLKVKILGKSLVREVFFNILKGERGYVLRNCVLHHASAHKIVPIIQYLEKHFLEPLGIDDIARYAGMSSSSLHSQFKTATSLSPIQFLKKLRLHRAHSMLMEGVSPGDAAFESGYGNQSQFSREFKRQFGFLPSHAKEPAQAAL